MSSGIDKREQALENKFFHDEGVKFKVNARMRKLMGLWASEKMNLELDAAEAYALELVKFGIDFSGESALMQKILTDLAAKNITVSETDIQLELQELHELAQRMVLTEMETPENKS